MDLLIGVHKSNVLLKLHRVKGDEGAEVTAELVIPWVTVPQVLEEHSFIGAGEITLRAVVGQVCPIVNLHVGLCLKNSSTGMMATFYCLDPVDFNGVSEKLFT